MFPIASTNVELGLHVGSHQCRKVAIVATCSGKSASGRYRPIQSGAAVASAQRNSNPFQTRGRERARGCVPCSTLSTSPEVAWFNVALRIEGALYRRLEAALRETWPGAAEPLSSLQLPSVRGI